MHKSEFGEISTSEFLYDWSCSSQDDDSKEESAIIIKNSSTCPQRCSAHKSCEKCLSSQVNYFK